MSTSQRPEPRSEERSLHTSAAAGAARDAPGRPASDLHGAQREHSGQCAAAMGRRLPRGACGGGVLDGGGRRTASMSREGSAGGDIVHRQSQSRGR